MLKEIKEIIDRNRDRLSNDIDLDDKLWNLLKKHAPNLISKATQQRIQAQMGMYAQISSLLDHLEKRPTKDFVNFCKSLVAAGQEGAVEPIENALNYAGTNIEAIKEKLGIQPDSSQLRPFGSRTKRKLDLNITDKAYKIKMKRSSKEFYDKNKDEAYPVEPKSRGYAIIINVKYVSGCHPRKATDIDRDKIVYLLKALEFEHIATYDDENGLDAEDIIAKVKGFVTSVSKRAKRVALFFLSHGGPGTISGTDGGEVKIDDLIQCVSPENAPGLTGLPKVMVFQACRGKMEAAPNAPLDKDLVVCFASHDGYVSLKHEDTGSLFIAAFVQVFEKYAHCDHIMELMENVKEQVREHAEKNSEAYQNLYIQHNLAKHLYFFPGHPKFKE